MKHQLQIEEEELPTQLREPSPEAAPQYPKIYSANTNNVPGAGAPGLDSETWGSEEPESTPERNPKPLPPAAPAVTIGRLISFIARSSAFIDFPGNESPELVTARSLVPLNEAHAGSEVALVFEDGDPARPIILGIMQSPEALNSTPYTSEPAANLTLQRDDETLVLTAPSEITLRCGKSSITLTSAGKILMRGAYLLSRSSGVNRIKGGSVQIN